MEFTNGDKSKHGTLAQKSLKDILIYCKNNNQISEFKENFRIGMPKFKNDKQFYAPFIITLHSGEQWILYSTTSLRTDRIKGQQWDSMNIKSICNTVTKSYLIYSDGISQTEINNFSNQHQKYINHDEYSCIDGIITHDRLLNLIEHENIVGLNTGKIKDIQRKNFENRIADILSNEVNFQKWKNNDKLLTGGNFSIFKKIMDSLKLSKTDVLKISATTDQKIIGKLPSGGNPKTDVFVTISCTDSEKIITISCKRSNSKKVSVHEYSAQSFSEILDKDNESLKELLIKFQNNPSLSAFGEQNIQMLENELIAYNEQLSKWVLAGIGGYGDPIKHWATHILTYDNNDESISFHTINEYITLLKNSNINGHFGSLFSWTYPSKKRGKSIQLKCKIIK